jgi:hypothetical protein
MSALGGALRPERLERSMTLRFLVGYVVWGFLAGGVTVAAHHAVQAQFDVNAPAVTLVGTLKKTEWINPHAKLHITVKNEKTGQMEDWELQMAAAAQLRRNGFPLSVRGGIKPGDPITATAFAARDGSTTGLLRSIKFPDGRTFTRGVYGEADLEK